MSHHETHVLDDLEKSLIGAAFLDGGVMALVRTQPEEFASIPGSHIWRACRALEALNRPIDVVTVECELASAGAWNETMFGYIADAATRVPTTDNAIEYSQRIRDAALARDVRNALAAVLERGKRDQMSGAELLTLALESLAPLEDSQGDTSCTIGELVRKRCTELETIATERLNGGRATVGCPTGIAKLDEYTGGYQPGIVSILAGRPGMAKSAAGIGAGTATCAAGLGVHTFSMEDTEESFADRNMARDSGVSANTIRSTVYSNSQFLQIKGAMMRMAKMGNWRVDSRSGLTAEEIVRSVRRHKRKNGTKLVIVDYIQLIAWPKYARTPHDALTQIITVLANAAKADGISYVVMSQLNRGVEQRDDKRPLLSDLRESGSLEERSKCVLALYRPNYYDPNADPTLAQILVLKNSNGQTGTVDATWDGPTMKLS